MKIGFNSEPLVSVAILTYNSSATIVETLDSVFAQTYPAIELIISDDRSTDNTIDLCRQWLNDHTNRFVDVNIVESPINTGTSANINRAISHCRGEWVKTIAGDDLLMPDCLQVCAEYMSTHHDAAFLFGRQQAFGADEAVCKAVDQQFDYIMFENSPQEQLRRLIFDGNYIPATTFFFRKSRMDALSIRFDERVPLLEDWPMWIQLLQAGETFHFINQVLTQYRVGGISTGGHLSVRFYESNRLFKFYYQYPAWYAEDRDEAVHRIVEEEMDVYRDLLKLDTDDINKILVENHHLQNRNKYLEEQLVMRRNSKAYQLGTKLLKPIRFITNLLGLK